MSIDRVNISHATIEPEKLTLLDDRILMEKIYRDKSAGGIHLVGQVRSECAYGRVLQVGRGVTAAHDGKTYPMDVKVGDTILVMDFTGDKLHSDDGNKDYMIVRDHQVWAKVKLGKNNELLDVEPYSSRVLVRITENLKTAGGVLLPDTHQTRGYTMATVVKTGKGWRDLKTGFLYPMTVKPGDVVCMTRYAGSIVKLAHDELRLIEERPYMESDPQPDILFVHEDWKGWEYER